MPRETVHTDVRPFGDDVPAVSAVEVSWVTGGKHVQLGTVMINADDGQPFAGAHQVGDNGWVKAGPAGSGWWPNWSGWYPTFYPAGDPVPSTFDPVPFQTIPMVPMDDGTVDKTGWCAECQAGHHTQCLDDTEEHSATDPDWCRCPCGEIKTALLEEHQDGTVQVRAGVEAPEGVGVQLASPGISSGVFVQLNRKELNELIRKLKRAGKMTFGEDEW